MATLNTATYANQIGSATSSAAKSLPQAKLANGKLRYAIVPYTAVGTEADGDIINIVKLKEGAVPVPSLCRIITSAAFDAADVNVGYGSNNNALADALDTTDAATDLPFARGDNALAPAALKAGEETIYATLVDVVAIAANDKALFLIAYTDE